MDDDKIPDTGDEEPRRIKVTDRRLFDRQGNPRSEPAPAAAASGPPDPPPAAAKPEPPIAARPEASAPAAAAEPGPGAGERPADQGNRIVTPMPSVADIPRDFSAFVEGMYLEAMLYLGAIADPRSGETIEDFELAKYKIDLLGMLQDKTEGNLSVEEKQQLEEVLYQLRMVYVQRTTPADQG